MLRSLFGRKGDPAPDDAASTASTPSPLPVARDEIDALVARGMAHLEGKRHALARAAFAEVLAHDPDHLVGLYQRANASLGAGDLAAARAECDAALERHAEQPDLLMLSGAIAAAAQDPAGALATFERAREVKPDLAGIDERIGEQLAFMGRGAEAIAAYDRALARSASNLALASNRLFLLNHFGLFDRQRTFDEHRSWGERLERMVAAARRPHHNDRSAERPLRIGFVSPDLRNHAIAYWLESYLVAHDRELFPAHAFDVSPYAEDAVSKRLRGRFDHWYRCGTMSDDEIAGLVRGQRIDVLVDLAGHTGHHRLGVFARKPAPVQVSWFGYMNTTGLTTIDWRITDPQHDPADAERYYTEKLWRIPSLAAFTPDPDSPAPGPPPFERHGFVTFASANNWAKVSEGRKDAWAAILHGAPRSRLKVVARGGGDPGVREAIQGEFARRGIDAARIDVLPFMPLATFLAFFGDVDVALDPFPYGGGTTTLHTLWMGVPVVALEGDAELARATPATMRGVGAAQFVASSVERYVEIAVSIARDPAPLAALREGMRDRMRASGALDYAGLAREVEGAFRGMWRAFCEASPEAPPSPFTSPPRA